MTIKYQKDKKYVTVKIHSDFISNNVCNVCEMDGPHHAPDHVFKITTTSSNDGTHEMRIFNDYNVHCTIPENTLAFAKLKPIVVGSGNICYFYGNRDKDDPTTLYIKIEELPFQ